MVRLSHLWQMPLQVLAASLEDINWPMPICAVSHTPKDSDLWLKSDSSAAKVQRKVGIQAHKRGSIHSRFVAKDRAEGEVRKVAAQPFVSARATALCSSQPFAQMTEVHGKDLRPGDFNEAILINCAIMIYNASSKCLDILTQS